MSATLSLAAVLAEAALRRPDHVALVDGDRRVTYGDLWDLARRHASALLARDVRPGDRLALLAPDSLEFVVGYFGVIAAGGVLVPLPPTLRAPEMTDLLRDADVKAVLVERSLAPAGAAAAGPARVPAWSLTGFADGHRPLVRYVARAPEDAAVIFYSGGITGRPKGAQLTHLNLVLNATANAIDGADVSRDDIIMCAAPLFHAFGQAVAMNCAFRVGATLLVERRFVAADTLALMAREQASIVVGVPTAFAYLAAHASESGAAPAGAGATPPLPSLRYGVCGGAPLTPAIREAFEAAFSRTIYAGYGLAETSPVATANQPGYASRAGTVGRAIWGVDVEIADPGQLDRIVFLRPGQRGEIIVRGHNVFGGYRGDPEATEQALVDEWFRTGDIGVKDDDGYVQVVDRLTDVVVRGGYLVYPREVEAVLMDYPGINRVAVIGVPDADLGEEICAVVVPLPGESIVADDLVEWARERLAANKYPRRVEVVDELPTGPMHKVLKRVLRERFAAPPTA